MTEPWPATNNRKKSNKAENPQKLQQGNWHVEQRSYIERVPIDWFTPDCKSELTVLGKNFQNVKEQNVKYLWNLPRVHGMVPCRRRHIPHSRTGGVGAGKKAQVTAAVDTDIFAGWKGSELKWCHWNTQHFSLTTTAWGHHCQQGGSCLRDRESHLLSS